jgi:uncharacterized protein (DUF2267 family)
MTQATAQEPQAPLGEPPELAGALDAARAWIADLMRRLDWHEGDTAFRALLSCLHALRDALPKDEAVHLGLALPHLLRGFYFDGWRPSGRVIAARTRSAFLARVHDGVQRDPAIDPDQAARAVLSLLAERLPASEIENAKAATPHELHGFWPT